MLRETASSHGITVEIEKAFLPEDAARIHDLLAHADPGVTIEIDFRRARDCADVALAALARDLVGRHAVALRGTSHHQRRLLAYFGVPAATASGGA